MGRAVMLVQNGGNSAEGLRKASLRNPDALFVHASRSLLARGGFVVQTEAQVKRLLVALAANAPNFLSDATVIGLLWGDQRDGGPLDVRRHLLVLLCRARTIAPALGYAIERMPGGFRAIAVGEPAFREAAE